MGVTRWAVASSAGPMTSPTPGGPGFRRGASGREGEADGAVVASGPTKLGFRGLLVSMFFVFKRRSGEEKTLREREQEEEGGKERRRGALFVSNVPGRPWWVVPWTGAILTHERSLHG